MNSTNNIWMNSPNNIWKVMLKLCLVTVYFVGKGNLVFDTYISMFTIQYLQQGFTGSYTLLSVKRVRYCWGGHCTGRIYFQATFIFPGKMMEFYGVKTLK